MNTAKTFSVVWSELRLLLAEKILFGLTFLFPRGSKERTIYAEAMVYYITKTSLKPK